MITATPKAKKKATGQDELSESLTVPGRDESGSLSRIKVFVSIQINIYVCEVDFQLFDIYFYADLWHGITFEVRVSSFSFRPLIHDRP